jgi:hypothetical protein
MQPATHALWLGSAQELAEPAPPLWEAGRDEADGYPVGFAIDLASAGNNDNVVADLGEAGGKCSSSGVVAVATDRNQGNPHNAGC